MKQFRKNNVEKIFMRECEGKNSCSVRYNFSDFARLPKDSQRENMVIFIQAECAQTDEML